jgi:glycosyltransferase involved in cell wall biosynthesis
LETPLIASTGDGSCLVSVGIPTFNRPEGLRRTLDAITRQTYPKLEIIVSDNASPGRETEKVVYEFATRYPKLQFHRQARNLGAMANFQFVLRQATGKYFMWAADDDDWDARFVDRCVAGFDRPDVVSVMSHFRTFYRASGIIEEPPVPHLDPARSKAHNLAAFLRTPTPTLMYGLHRRDALEFIQVETDWFYFYDCYFSLRLLTLGKIRILPEVLFTGGVDAADYAVKQADSVEHVMKRVAAQRWVQLSYLPFFRAARAAIAASDLSRSERTVAVAILGLTVARLFIHHEIRNRR